VEEDLRNLRKRVSTLERNGSLTKNGDVREEFERDITKSRESFATAGEDGLGGLRTCAHLIRSKKAALLQCIWLAIFVITLSTFGILKFLEARDNMRAEFKPEKKFQTIDYGDTESDEQYETPYMYLYFFCEKQLNDSEIFDKDWSNDEINETLTYFLESQNYFQNSSRIHYIADNFQVLTDKQSMVEVKAFYEEAWVLEDSFLGYFRLKLADPDPSLGTFQYTLFIDTEPLTRNWTLWVRGFWVSVGRELSTMIWEELIYVSTDKAILYGSKVEALIDYDEKVTRTWRNGYVNLFTASLGHYYERGEEGVGSGYPDGQLVLSFRGNSMIGHWEEYVAYDYYDWCSSMGGLLSIASIIFFWGAYYLAVIFGEENTMGILPVMSKVFSNFENIQLLKHRVLVD